MPAEHELLLAAIRAEPDEGTPRLAFADWLQENGDAARAEFVRVQCRLAALGHGPMWPAVRTPDPETLTRGLEGEHAELILRQAGLWQENREAWLGELPDIPGTTLLFHRGFAAAAVVEHPGGLVRNGAKLLAAAPVARVTFRGCTPDAFSLVLSKPWLDPVRGLAVAWASPPAGVGNRLAEVVGTAEHPARLRDLSLFGLRVSNTGAHAIASAPFARRLARLDLAGNRVGDSGALSVANALDPAVLRVLDLSGNPLTYSCRANLRRRLGDKVCLDGAEEPAE